MGLHVHLDRVFRDNLLKQGPEIQRKNNFIINTGDNLTAQNREMRIKENNQKYGLTSHEIKALKLPKPASKQTFLTIEQIFHPKSNFSIVEKLVELEKLRDGISKKLKRLDNLEIKRQRMHQRRILIEENKTNKCIVLRKISDDDELDLNDMEEDRPVKSYEYVKVIHCGQTDSVVE